MHKTVSVVCSSIIYYCSTPQNISFSLGLLALLLHKVHNMLICLIDDSSSSNAQIVYVLIIHQPLSVKNVVLLMKK